MAGTGISRQTAEAIADLDSGYSRQKYQPKQAAATFTDTGEAPQLDITPEDAYRDLMIDSQSLRDGNGVDPRAWATKLQNAQRAGLDIQSYAPLNDLVNGQENMARWSDLQKAQNKKGIMSQAGDLFGSFFK